MTRLMAVAAALALAGCSDPIEAGGSGVDAGVDDDPLAVPAQPDDGSLDHIHRTIIARRCAGVPGLCHNGQFEPNLSTPAMTYAYLVNRPALENNRKLRVEPDDPDASFLIDKLRNRDVATQMPLGAEPLSEEEIELIEDWIRDGARRAPGAGPAPRLNNPPAQPEIGVFDGSGTRLDMAGPFSVPTGQTLTFRHSVHDFETDDEDVPFAVMVLQAPDGREVVTNPDNTDNPALMVTSFDPSGPMGNGDALNYEFDFAFGATIDLRDPDTGAVEAGVDPSGMTFNVIAAYVDGLDDDNMAVFSIEPGLLTVE